MPLLMDCLRYAKVARHTKKTHRTKKNHFFRPTMALHHPTSPLPSSPTTAPHPPSATSIMALTSSAGRSASSSSSLMRSNKSRRRHRLVLFWGGCRSHTGILLTTTPTRLATASINAQTHLRWVFGSTAPADVPTAKHPGLCLGYTFIK